MNKPMSPTLTFDVPKGEQWRYEVKYDGYRCLIKVDNNIVLTSKNGKSLNKQFPEIVSFFEQKRATFAAYLPLIFDGEIVVLENEYKSNFEIVQKRGRLQKEERINEERERHPAAYMIFDLLMYKGKPLKQKNYLQRRNVLLTNFCKLISQSSLHIVPSFQDYAEVEQIVTLHNSEGIVAKLISSTWESGTTTSWLKLKNWKTITAFISAYDKNNGYFHISVLKEQELLPIGLFSHGLKEEERTTLKHVIEKNKTSETSNFIFIDPSICVELFCLELYRGQLREPYFHRFRTDLTWEQCTVKKLERDLTPLPKSNLITNEKKVLWERKKITKEEYIRYLLNIATYSLPFLNERLLTVIRYPNGITEESFYQKNCPDYAPTFVDTHVHEGINYILCNRLETYVWLGNQGAIEFHVPFQQATSMMPAEIVFDLDPPSTKHFHLAVIAARMIKEICDELQLTTFVKTSGNKGLQVYIPLPDSTYTYNETRMFTSFIAQYLVTNRPDIFTIERLKKKRGSKLYIDFIQHAEGKTIIAPYSARATENATVATPLFWEEVVDGLSPLTFTMTNVLRRVKEKGCPFATFFQIENQQSFEKVSKFLKQQLRETSFYIK